MVVTHIVDEYDIGIDDVRWYLSVREAERILTYKDSSTDLAVLIQSGRLEADWYRMEEHFLEELQNKLDKGRIDEPEIRKICGDIETARRNRYSA